MDVATALALIGATTVLVCIPGPNVALFVANTVERGFKHGVATVVGTTIGIAAQLAMVVVGFAFVLHFAAFAFGWLKWAGVAYLLYLGVQSWRQGRADALTAVRSEKALAKMFWQGFFLAIVNPKTLLFAAAFLPQFVSASADSFGALAMPAILYLSVVFVGDITWVTAAHSAKPLLSRLGRLRHRLTGALFIFCGLGLAVARAER